MSLTSPKPESTFPHVAGGTSANRFQIGTELQIIYHPLDPPVFASTVNTARLLHMLL